MTILWTPRAASDLDDIIDYIAADSPDAAVRVGDRIRSQVQRLSSPPDIGHTGAVPGTRERVIHPWPYIALYRIDRDTVRIIRIRHGSRRWPVRG